MLNISTIMYQPITKPRISNMGTVERGKLIDKRVLEALRHDKELSAQTLAIVTDSSGTGINSAINRLICERKLERIKNPEREYGKPSYLFRLV